MNKKVKKVLKMYKSNKVLIKTLSKDNSYKKNSPRKTISPLKKNVKKALRIYKSHKFLLKTILNKKSNRLTIKNIKDTYNKATDMQNSRQLRYYYRLKHQSFAIRVNMKENQLLEKTQRISQDTINVFPAISRFTDQLKWERFKGAQSTFDKDLHIRLRNIRQATSTTNKLVSKGMETYIKELADWEAKYGKKKRLNAFERHIIDDWGSEEWAIYWNQYYSHYIDESLIIK